MVYDKDKLIGRMRFDFCNGPSCLSNSWYPVTEIDKEEINEVNSKVNEIMFNRFFNFNEIIKECGGEGHDKEKIIEEKTINFDYAIKLIPVEGTYNGYIFVYRK